MSLPSAGYPHPDETEVNRPFLEGWRRGKLLIQRCADCSMFVFFPRELCPHCWCSDMKWVEAKGTGEVVSHSLVYSHVTEPFVSEAPVVLAEIRLSEGLTLLARILVDLSASIASGMPVELVPLPEASRYPLPTFRSRLPNG